MKAHVTIMVRKIGGRFIASAGSSEVIEESATLAARACAANYFAVPESAIEIEIVSVADNAGVLRGSVAKPAPGPDWGLFFAALFCLVALGFGYAILVVCIGKGGAS